MNKAGLLNNVGFYLGNQEKRSQKHYLRIMCVNIVPRIARSLNTMIIKLSNSQNAMKAAKTVRRAAAEPRTTTQNKISHASTLNRIIGFKEKWIN